VTLEEETIGMGTTVQPPARRTGLVTVIRALPGRLGAGLAAVLALLAVLLSSKLLVALTVAFALTVLAGSVAGVIGGALGLLAPVVAPLRGAAAWVGRPLAALARRLDGLLARVERWHVAIRVALWLAIVAATLVLLALGAYLVSGWMGAVLAGRTKPLALEALYAGALASATVLTVVLGLWIAALGLLVFRARWRPRTVLTAALLVVGVLIGLMTTPSVPRQLELDDQTRAEGERRIDVLVAVDPADPAGQELAELVRSSRATLTRPRTNALPFDVALGLTMPPDPAIAKDAAPWTVVEPPTDRLGHFLDALALIPPRAGRTVSLEPLLARLRDDGFAGWRPDARRTVAIVTSRLPATTFDTAPPARLVVLTRERRRDRIGLWRSWLERHDGRLVTYRRADATLLADIQDAATGSPVSAVRALAERFSPHLRFDSGERFFPVDVDDLLGEPTAGSGHRVCERDWPRDDCARVYSYHDLLSTYGEYIDFEGGARLGQDLVDRDVALGIRRTIYVDAVARGNRLHLAYWWYMRYNVSPWRPERNCLPGLTFAEATCFDHEGDWEGVTVTLRTRSSEDVPDRYAPERWRLESVSYASHAFITRWASESIELVGDGSTHPVVYVAQGSHAAYPTRCAEDCTQKLAGSGLPEGDFDGRQDWSENATACCVPLPVTPEHEGALWNAFPGRWGKAVCTAFIKVCSASDGPRSPSRQRRFTALVGASFAGQRAVLDRHRRRYGSATAVR
jgi:hypothetical protein